MTELITLPAAPLVEADWLLANQSDVTLLDASIVRKQDADGSVWFAPGLPFYRQQHLPGALFADLHHQFSQPTAARPFTCPSRSQLQQALRQLGVNQQTTLVLYDQAGGAWAARLWFLLSVVAGLSRVRVLNGGLSAWRGVGGQTVSGEPPAPAPGNITLTTFNPQALLSSDQVAALAQHPDPQRPLLCALRHLQYQDGHIPASRSAPYPATLDEQGRIDRQKIADLRQQLALATDAQPVLYCGGGINAAGLALALVADGFPPQQLAIYDDSLSGWRADARPLSSGDEPGHWPFSSDQRSY